MTERRYLHLNLVANDINLHQGAYAFEKAHGIAERGTFDHGPLHELDSGFEFYAPQTMLATLYGKALDADLPKSVLHDTYYVVAHFHYVLFGTIVFATYAGIYFWFPKMTGRMLDERLGKFHFWLTFIGFHTTFLVQHWLGNEGMPRRYADYLPSDGFTTLNVVSTIGAFTLGISTLPFLWNVFKSWRYGEVEIGRAHV